MSAHRVAWLDDGRLQLEDYRTQAAANARIRVLRARKKAVYPDSPYIVDGIIWKEDE